MDSAGDSHTRLADAIETRRLDLDLTWKELAARAGISTTTFENVRGGRIPRTRTRRRIEDALGWVHGSISAILAGGMPTLTDDAPQQERASLDPRTASPEELAVALEELRQYLIREHGEQVGLDLFAEEYRRLLGIRAGERRMRERDESASIDRTELPTPKPNG